VLQSSPPTCHCDTVSQE